MYWKGGKSQASISHFSLYMSFFPQLLSGPIARGKDFLPQIGLERSLEYDNVASGARLILWGLFKKLVIADNLSPYTDAVFNNLHSHSGLTLIFAMFAYTVQVYMDFSGYSDIAIGSAKILGFKLLENFRTPYFAQSVTDFWRRWHISLSSWVRDYVNTPLQYRFRSFGLWGILGSAFITFFIIGIWHGAYWNYVLFGLIQGAAITYEVLTQKVRAGFWKHIPSFICNALSNIVVFFFFSLSVILLRTSVANAILFYSKMSFDPQGLYLGSKQLIIYSAIGFGVVLCVELMARGQIIVDYFRRQGTILRWFYYVSCSLLILILGSLSSENFIYFQF
jgi:D-alanyl-lipoteichoic acid acyltransferase DltB (MBOAT superfamily)